MFYESNLSLACFLGSTAHHVTTAGRIGRCANMTWAFSLRAFFPVSGRAKERGDVDDVIDEVKDGSPLTWLLMESTGRMPAY